MPLLLAPLPLVAVALLLLLRPPPRAGRRLRWPEAAALLALALGAASAVDLALRGPSSSPLLGAAGLGLSARTDVVSVTMALLVAFVGWVVLRFSATALDGEPRQAAFLAWMGLLLAAVLALVTAGNLGQLVLAWAGVGVAIDRLLLFYPERPAARRAARKKAVTGLAGTVALALGAGLLVWAYGTGDIAAILAEARGGPVPAAALWAAAAFGAAAAFKSALAPAHGWLTEVMEAPTPVSALLHAGVVNAGGFLLIRFADLILAAPGVMAALAILGGLSALLGAVVMLTQPSVKTALAWSTCAQMGFMVLQCGLGLFPLALLHIVAHSLYKAHAFLGSGRAVEAVAAVRAPGPVAVPGGRAILRAFGLALGLYLVLGLAAGLAGKPPQAIALGGMLVLGVAYLIAQGLADAAPRALTRRTLALSAAATLGYFALQTGAEALAAGTLPPPPAPDALGWTVLILAVASFAAVAVAQATLPLWAGHPVAAGLRVHLANGLYLNALANRWLGGWSLSLPSKDVRP